MKTAFDALTTQVKEQKLAAAQDNLTDIEREIDKYIAEHNLHYVLDGAGTSAGKFYIYYERTKEWVPLSWYKLRRDCPIVFTNPKTYLIHQQTVMVRLKKLGRVYRTIRLKEVLFE